jgi:hypothetical protein
MVLGFVVPNGLMLFIYFNLIVVDEVDCKTQYRRGQVVTYHVRARSARLRFPVIRTEGLRSDEKL